MKQISVNIIWNFFYSSSNLTTSQQCRGRVCFSEPGGIGLEFSLSSSSSSRMGFSAEPPISKSSSVVGQKGVSLLGVKIQLIIFPVEVNVVQIRHLIPACLHILRAYTWEHFVPHIPSSFLVGSS